MKMPLVWDLTDTEWAKQIDEETKRKEDSEGILFVSTSFICILGMEVLNEIGQGYTPTLNYYELGEKTARKIVKHLLSSDIKWNSFEKKQIRKVIPMMVGARFRRRG
jgi:hypothetical protein